MVLSTFGHSSNINYMPQGLQSIYRDPGILNENIFTVQVSLSMDDNGSECTASDQDAGKLVNFDS